MRCFLTPWLIVSEKTLVDTDYVLRQLQNYSLLLSARHSAFATFVSKLNHNAIFWKTF